MKVSYIMLYLSALSEAVARAAAAWTAAPRPPPGVAAAFFRMWYMVRICNMAGGVSIGRVPVTHVLILRNED
jgi:hypothetical protein